MKKRVPIWMLFCALTILLLCIGTAYVHKDKSNIMFEEYTYSGDIAVCDGLSIAYSIKEGIEEVFRYDIDLTFQDGLSWGSRFREMFYSEYVWTSPKDAVTMSYTWEKINEANEMEMDGTYEYRIKDFYTYHPLEFRFMYQEYVVEPFRKKVKYNWIEFDATEYLRIHMPNQSVYIIHKDRSGISGDLRNFSFAPFVLPSVQIENRYYFTISNQRLEYDDEDEWWYRTEYTGTSGIMRYTIEEDKTRQFIQNPNIQNSHIDVLMPLEIGTGCGVTTLGIDYIEEKKLMVLIAIEHDELMFYLYDIEDEILVSKNKVGNLPKQALVRDMQLKSQGDYLIFNYQYEFKTENNVLEQYTVGAVYEINDELYIDVCMENEYYSKLPEAFVTGANELLDMQYQNGVLYMIYDYRGYVDNRFLLAAIDHEAVLYSGSIQSSFYEDGGIGSTLGLGAEIYTRYRYRHMDQAEFQ